MLDDSGLLDLDGDLYVINEAGYWVKFEVKRTAITPERPHGIDYSITLHDPKNNRIAGFDNGHAFKRKGKRVQTAYDHKHRFETIKAYEYRNALKLIEDFWTLVDAVLKEEEVEG